MVEHLPPYDSDFTRKYGWIDLEVYEIGQSIWPFAKRYGVMLDENHALDLMLRAIASVSKAKQSTAIKSLRKYLLTSYKHLVYRAVSKESHQPEISMEDLQQDSLAVDALAVLERKILVQQVATRMDYSMRFIFEHLVLGFSFSEIAALDEIRKKGWSAHYLRTLFARKMKELTKQIRDEEDRAIREL
jgi:DNA-directed RNA polymerase specialized sigma24 family protein